MTVPILHCAPVTAAEDERPALKDIDRLLERADSRARLMGPGGEAIDLPEPAFQLLHRLVHCLARGQAVTLVPVDKHLTTQQAADLLNVSRPHLVQLLERGEIPHTKTGRRRRVRFDDLMAYKRHRDADRREALHELSRLNQDLGLYQTASQAGGS